MAVPSHPTDLTFTVRDYRPTDFEQLWSIDQQCFPEGISYSQMELNGFITRRNAVTLVGEFATSAEENAVSADAQRIAGFVIAHSVRHRYGRILTLDIVPEARRSGLATTLMNQCERRLRNSGCREIYLETAVDNEPAIRLYRKLGYRILRTLPEYYVSHALDAFQMGKRL